MQMSEHYLKSIESKMRMDHPYRICSSAENLTAKI